MPKTLPPVDDVMVREFMGGYAIRGAVNSVILWPLWPFALATRRIPMTPMKFPTIFTRAQIAQSPRQRLSTLEPSSVIDTIQAVSTFFRYDIQLSREGDQLWTRGHPRSRGC